MNSADPAIPAWPERVRCGCPLCGRLLAGCLLGLLLGAAGCGPAPTGHATYADLTNPLQAYLTAEPDTAGRLEPFVEVTVPRRSLVFYRDEGWIEGGVEVTVVAERDGRQVGGGAGQLSLRLADWEATEADSLVVCSVPLVVTGEEPVQLRVRARSLDSQRTWERLLQYEPGQLADLPYLFSTFDWNQDGPERLGCETDSLRCRVAVTVVVAYDGGDSPAAETPGTDPVVRTRMGINVTGPEGFERDQESNLAAAAEAGGIVAGGFTLAAADLPFGRLRVMPYLATAGTTSRIVRNWQPGWATVNYHLDLADDQVWDRNLAWLEGKLPAAAVDGLKRIPTTERETAWRAAWAETAADPDTALQQHLDLIVEADARFTASRRGSLTDRGRAWIRYGPPDEIDSVSDPQSRGARREVWIYQTLALRLSFLDAHGLGDFRLLEKESLDR